jgi:hypothetical protein
VRQVWSQFQFFVKPIEQALASGSTASEAIRDFENQRGQLSVPKFHKMLQPKKGRKGHVSADS